MIYSHYAIATTDYQNQHIDSIERALLSQPIKNYLWSLLVMT